MLDMKKVFLIGASILGQIVLFCVLREFRPVIGDDRMLVNLIFLSLAYWVFIGQFFVPPVSSDDQESKWVGSLGIHLHGLSVYCLATLSVAYISNVAFLLPCHWQLYIHLGVVAVFLLYNFFSRTANEHVGEVYYEEKMKKQNLRSLKQISSSLKMNVALMDDIPADIVRQLDQVDEDIKDLVPLFSNEALQLEQKIGDTLLHIESYLSNPQENAQAIADTFRLVRTYIRRRQILTD